ncbi:hypothetical protein ACFXI9_26730 [Streptomyces sp. NPDC059243]|uniref:SCO4983 family protein n=1 Tax=Streptomyces sp. NPDC059243 TaxID=3346788 RepID=UPI0036B5517E
MYEPIRSPSVHTPADDADFPHRSREEELDIQLAGHLAALLAVTDELGLGAAGDRVAEQVARLRGAPPARHAGRPRIPTPLPPGRRSAVGGGPGPAPARREGRPQPRDALHRVGGARDRHTAHRTPPSLSSP